MKKHTLSRIERSSTQTFCRPLLWAALSLILTGQSVFSQDKPEDGSLETIMVTAQQRSESIRGVGTSDISATVIGPVNYISNQPTLEGQADSYISVHPGIFGPIDRETAGTISRSDKSALHLPGKSYTRDGI
jgi:hypothetical protein